MGKASNKKKQNRETQEEDLTTFPVEIKSVPLRRSVVKMYFHLLLIAVIGVIAYSNTFHVSFILDDIGQIKDNLMIRDLDNFLPALKGHDFSSGAYRYIPSRFVGYLSFALNYYFGGVDVKGYHITNLFIHIANAVLVYLFVQLTFKTPYFKSQTPDATNVSVNSSLPAVHYSSLIPLFSALLFVSHPLQTQAVTYTVQRFASLATLFYLLSLVLYIKGRLAGQKQGEAGGAPLSASSVLYFFLSLFSVVLAMKTKEIAFTLPLVIILYEFTFFEAPLRKKLLFLLPVLLTLIIVPIGLLHSSKPFGEILSDIGEKTRVATDISRWDYLMTELRVVTTYIRLIFVPINQNLDYDYPIYHSLLSPSVFLSFIFILSVFGLGVYLLYRAHRAPSAMPSAPYYRLIAFGIFWFFITISVESSFIPIVDVIFEHRVYLPSAGFFIAITAGIFIVATKLKKKKSIIPIFLLITLALSVATYARNNIWKDEVSLWEDIVKKSPNKARPHNDLGAVYYSQNRLDDALRESQVAVRLDPNYADAHNNLGAIYERKGRLDEAMIEFQTQARLKPDFDVAHYNLGKVYDRQGRLDEAMKEYKVAIRLNPNYAEAHNNFGTVYYKQGRLDEAMREYQVAVRLSPDNAEAHNNIGAVYYKQGRLDEAMREYQAAVRLIPDYAEAHSNLGAAYYKQGRLDDAIREFQEVVRLKPDNATARNNLEILNEKMRSKKL